jgi:hypothetical protein
VKSFANLIQGTNVANIAPQSVKNKFLKCSSQLLKEEVGLAKVVLAPALVDAEFEAIYRQNMPATLAEARLAEHSFDLVSLVEVIRRQNKVGLIWVIITYSYFRSY